MSALCLKCHRRHHHHPLDPKELRSIVLNTVPDRPVQHGMYWVVGSRIKSGLVQCKMVQFLLMCDYRLEMIFF